MFALIGDHVGRRLEAGGKENCRMIGSQQDPV